MTREKLVEVIMGLTGESLADRILAALEVERVEEKAVLASESRWAKTYLEKTLLLERALMIACKKIAGVVGKCDTCEIDFYKTCQHNGRTCDEMLSVHFKAKAEKL